LGPAREDLIERRTVPTPEQATEMLRGGDLVAAHRAFAERMAAGDDSRRTRSGLAWSYDGLGRFDLSSPVWEALAADYPDDLTARWRVLFGRAELGDLTAEEALVSWALDGPAHRGVLLSAVSFDPATWTDRVPALIRRFDDFPDRSTRALVPSLLDADGQVGAGDDLARELLAHDNSNGDADPIEPRRAARLQLRLHDRAGFERSCAATVAAEIDRPSLGGMRTLRRWLLRPDSVGELVDIVRRARWRAGDPLGAVGVAEVAITVGHDDLARTIADTVAATPAAQAVEAARLLAWVDASSGDFDQARARIRATEWPATRHHRRRNNAAEPTPISAAPRSAPVVVFGAMHNEVDEIESYLAHHRSLGIDCFWIVDDRSTDGTRELLATQPDVYVFDAVDDFSASANGSAWFVALAKRLPPDRRIAVIDADERLVLPLPFGDVEGFLDALDDNDAVHANVIDVFDAGDGSLWFDTDLLPVGRVGAPYRGLVGGVRYRLLDRDTAPELVKTLFIRANRFDAYWSTHEVGPVRVADQSVSLLHTKLLGDLASGGSRKNLDRRQAHRLAGTSRVEPSTHSVRYEGRAQLAALGLVGAQPPVGGVRSLNQLSSSRAAALRSMFRRPSESTSAG
jgi:hypothetical protein